MIPVKLSQPGLNGKTQRPNKQGVLTHDYSSTSLKNRGRGVEVSTGYIGEILSQKNKKEMRFRSQTRQEVTEAVLRLTVFR